MTLYSIDKQLNFEENCRTQRRTRLVTLNMLQLVCLVSLGLNIANNCSLRCYHTTMASSGMPRASCLATGACVCIEYAAPAAECHGT